MRKTLITFGCSWTFGVGAHYESNLSRDEYERTAWLPQYIEPYTFRRLISDRCNLKNINLAKGGSSNQLQFRLAKEFFFAKDDKWFEGTDITVLWGITSVYRNEFFNSMTKEYDDFSMVQPGFREIIFKKYFDESVEIEKLSQEMKLFDYFFANKGIKNYWFNTFNNHKYKLHFDNLLFQGKDLLSILVKNDNDNNKYHKSDWNDTDVKINQAKELGLVNPFTLHPTNSAHKILAEHFIKEIDYLE